MIATESIEQLSVLDQQHILHPASSIKQIQQQGPRIISHGYGATITDAHGQQCLDGVGGLWCVNIGYGNAELANEMASASKQLSYFHTFNGASNVPQIKLAEKLLTLVPDSLSKVFFGNSGSDANDTLLKLMWQYQTLRGKPQKHKVVARKQAYHGTSVATASLTGLTSFHANNPLPLDFVLHTSAPFYYRDARDGESEEQYTKRLMDELESLIDEHGADTIGAFIAEPVMGAGGVIPPPKGYFEALQTLLKKHDIVFIVDEVVSGFGRLGQWFASDVYQLKPDMMATAKGLTSGYFPLSAAFISEDIWRVLSDSHTPASGLAHGYTYSGHPVGAAVALRNIHLLESGKYIQHATAMGELLHQQLQEILGSHPRIGEVRGLGLLAGIQLVADKKEKLFYSPTAGVPGKIAQRAYELGAIVRPLPSVGTLALSPPLCISEEQVQQLVSILAEAVHQVLGFN